MTFTIAQNHVSTSLEPVQSRGAELSWDWLDKVELETEGGQGNIIAVPIKVVRLKGTPLTSVVSTEGTAWENRVQYIKAVVQDIVAGCPKDEPLVLISMGAGHLLMEYLIGKALFKNGFQKTAFYLVDTEYKFHEKEEASYTKERREKLEALLSKEFHETFGEPLLPRTVHYFSRAENIAKYFPANSHVALLEAFPPYGCLIAKMTQSNILGQKIENTFMGSSFVPPQNANALALIPANFLDEYKRHGTTFAKHSSIPLMGIKNPRTNANFCFDWGCKIYSDGTFLVSFFGGENFIDTIDISFYRLVKMPSGRKIAMGHFIAAVEGDIKALLTEEIEGLRKKKGVSELIQEDKTTLLQKVEQLVNSMAFFKPFFTADYPTDMKELKAYLSKAAGHTYRKSFSCMADPIASFKIENSIIL